MHGAGCKNGYTAERLPGINKLTIQQRAENVQSAAFHARRVP